MKIIDYCPSNDNIFIITDDENYLKVIENEETVIFNSQEGETINARYVCFSHDGNNIVYLDDTNDLYEKLTIMEYSELFEINVDGGRIINFVFTTDGDIINYVLSPNYNHIAILFTCRETYSDTENGVKNILDGTFPMEYQYKNILHVYDFTTGHKRLIFSKIYNEDNEIIFTLSEMNTIAIVSEGEDIDIDDLGEYSDLCIYDLITGNKTIQKYLRNDTEYRVNLIQFYPELFPYNNHLVLITNSLNREKNMRILDLENDFREIYNKRLNEDDIVFSIAINSNGHIALGTDNGLDIYHSLDRSDNDYDKLFENDTIVDISFTQNSEKVAIATSVYDRVLQTHIYPFKIFDFSEGAIIYNSNPHDDDDDDSESEWEHYSVDEEDHVIDDPELDTCIVPPTNVEKLTQHGNQSCFNVIEGKDEDSIGNYLAESSENIVIFYKNPEQADFFATCLTFTALKTFLKDPKSVYYSCVTDKPFEDYYKEPPEYLKIPSQTNIYVNYNDIKRKFIQRQNMIFLELEKKVEETVSYNVSITGVELSGWHCGKGTSINVYRIIF